MPQPYDYRLNLPNPAQAVLEGVQISQGIRANQQVLEATKQETERKDNLNKLLGKIGENPSVDQLMEVSKYLDPKLMESMLEVRSLRTKEEQDNELTFTGQVITALKSDNPQIGIDMFLERAEAYRNDGDEESAKEMETWAELSKGANPSDISNLIAVMTTSLGEEGQKMIESIFGTEKTKAEISKLDAEKSKLLSEAKKIDAELQGIGALSPEDKAKGEDDLRAEYVKRLDDVEELRTQYGKMKAAAEDNTGQGDVGLIFNFMKMLDPTSVVRESEYARAAEAQGFFEELRLARDKALSMFGKAAYDQFNKDGTGPIEEAGHKLGHVLTPTSRKRYLRLAEKFMNSSDEFGKKVQRQLTGVAERRGLDTKNIFYEEDITPTGEVPPPEETEFDYLGEYIKTQ